MGACLVSALVAGSGVEHGPGHVELHGAPDLVIVYGDGHKGRMALSCCEFFPLGSASLLLT